MTEVKLPATVPPPMEPGAVEVKITEKGTKKWRGRGYYKNQVVSFLTHDIEITTCGSMYERIGGELRRVEGLYFREVDRFLLTLVNKEVCWLRRNAEGVVRALPVAKEDLDAIEEMNRRKADTV